MRDYKSEEKSNYRIIFSREAALNDVRLQNGFYAGKLLRELWKEDGEAKDYIYRYLSPDPDPFLKSILRELIC